MKDQVNNGGPALKVGAGMAATVLATELATAAALDDGESDISAGIYGPNVSALLRRWASDFMATSAHRDARVALLVEQMDILRDDFLKYQEGHKSTPFVVLRDALVAALESYDDARAVLAKARGEA